jgi:hypothetical protein
MSNYTQNTSFTAKDNLVSGDPAKIIRGSDFDAEFDEISTAIASKEDSSNKGAANGYAPLDAATLLSTAYLPIVPVTKGGTGVATVTAKALLAGNGTGAMTEVLLGTAGQVVRSDGVDWVAADLIAADIPDLDAAKIATGTLSTAVLPTIPAAKGGTGRTTLDVGSFLVGNGTDPVTLLDAATTMNTVGAERTITAGDGLTGGGTLAANRTVSLNTPGTLTRASGNTADGSGHTHAIGAGIVKAHVATGGQIFMSEADPTGGTDGDIWFKVAPV